MAIKPAAGRANGRDGSLGCNVRVNEGDRNARPFTGKMKTLGWFADLTECSKTWRAYDMGYRQARRVKGAPRTSTNASHSNYAECRLAQMPHFVAHGGFPHNDSPHYAALRPPSPLWPSNWKLRWDGKAWNRPSSPRLALAERHALRPTPLDEP
jgi:hypothetical protein